MMYKMLVVSIVALTALFAVGCAPKTPPPPPTTSTGAKPQTSQDPAVRNNPQIPENLRRQMGGGGVRSGPGQ
jgi:hypothetical protein